MEGPISKRPKECTGCAAVLRWVVAFSFILQQTVTPLPSVLADYAAVMDPNQINIPETDPSSVEVTSPNAETVPGGSLDQLRLADSPLSAATEEEADHETWNGLQLHVSPAFNPDLAADFLNDNPLSMPTMDESAEEVLTAVDGPAPSSPAGGEDFYLNDSPLSDPAAEESGFDVTSTPTPQAVSFREALESGELRQDYASAVLLQEPFTRDDLEALRNADFEIAVGVVEGQLVAFTSGQGDEISMTSEAYRFLKENATFFIHNHPGSFEGPSESDLVKAIADPYVEYVIDENYIHGYNKNGSLGTLGETKLLENLADALAGAPDDETAAREALNFFIAEQDRLGSAHEVEKTVFRGEASLVTPLNSKFLYLNFHGQYFSSWGGYSNVTLGAYDRDGNLNNFSTAELDMLDLIIGGMKDHFSPFALEIFTSFEYTEDEVSFDPKKGLEVVMGSGTSDFLGGAAGGVAYINSWSSSWVSSVLVFEDNLGNGHSKYVVDAGAHEVGHAFGLYHSADYEANGSFIRDYHLGDGHAAPTMGVGYYSDFTLWANNPAYDPNTKQDDLAIMTSAYNGVGYRADDHPGTFAGATAFEEGLDLTLSTSGIIEQIDDQDFFVFNTASGNVTVNVDTQTLGMLDPKVSIYDYLGNLVTVRDLAGHDETFTISLAEGTYYAVVESHGTYLYDSVIDGYGYHLGSYDINVTVPAGSFDVRPILDPIGPQTIMEGSRLSFTVTGHDPEGQPVAFSVAGLPAGASFDPNTGAFDWTPDLDQEGEYEVTFTISDGGKTTSEVVPITVTNYNTPPAASGQNVTIDEDTAVQIQLSGSDDEGDTLTFEIIAGPAHGTLTGSGSDWTYTPLANFNGTDTFSYRIFDGTEYSQMATVSITVSPVDDPVETAAGLLFTRPAASTYPDTASGSLFDKYALPLSSQNAASVSVRIRHDELSAGSIQRYLTDVGERFVLRYDSQHQNRSNLHLYMSLDDGRMEHLWVPYQVPVNQEFHAAGTWDGSTLRLYVNGNQIASKAISGTIRPALGGVYVSVPGPETFKGSLSDVTAWEKALTAQEVRDLAEGTLPLEYDPDDNDPNNPGNTRPVLNPIGNRSVNEGELLTITVSGSDGDNDDLVFSAANLPSGASFDSAARMFSWTPGANQAGTHTVTFSVSDGIETVNEVITITVNDVNNKPATWPLSVSINEDQPVSVSLTGSASDPDGDDLTFSLVSGTIHGSVTVDASGFFNYTPNPNFAGVDEFLFKVNDGQENSNTAKVTITVKPKQDPPTANAKTFTMNENTVLNGALNGSDPDNDNLTFHLHSSPSQGSIGLSADGTFTYTPNAGYEGADLFYFRVHDGTEYSQPALVTINVTPVNEKPVLNPIPDQTVEEGQTLSFQATATDANGDTLTFWINDRPAGSTFDQTTGVFTWTPGEGTAGIYEPRIIVGDGENFDVKTVKITVTGPDPNNEVPVLNPIGNRRVMEGSLLEIQLSATDAEGDTLTYSVAGGPAGSMILSQTGLFRWTPVLGQAATYNVTFHVTDGNKTASETIQITVDPYNGGPVINPIGNKSVNLGDRLNFTVGASDPEGDALTWSVSNLPAGAGFNSNNQRFTWTPAANQVGSHQVTFTATDGRTPVSETITITVLNNNSNPVANPVSVSVNEDQVLNGQLSGSDEDGDSFTFLLVSGTLNGSVSVNADGTFTYTPAANFNGTDSFTFRVNDGSVNSNVATATITVNSVNDRPIVQNAAIDVTAGTPFSGNLSGTDADGDALIFSLNSNAANGSVTMNADGSFTYTPDAGFEGTDSFSYVANDGSENSLIATVSVTVTAEPPPSWENGRILYEGDARSYPDPVEGNMYDVYHPPLSYENAASVSAVVRHDDLEAGDVQRYITDVGERMVIRYDAEHNNSPHLHFYMKTDDGALHHLWIPYEVREGVDYHIAGTWDGNEMKLFVNGQMIGSQRVTGTIAPPLGDVYVGVPGPNAFYGSIREIGMWDRGLTEDEIREMYNSYFI